MSHHHKEHQNYVSTAYTTDATYIKIGLDLLERRPAAVLLKIGGTLVSPEGF